VNFISSLSDLREDDISLSPSYISYEYLISSYAESVDFSTRFDEKLSSESVLTKTGDLTTSYVPTIQFAQANFTKTEKRTFGPICDYTDLVQREPTTKQDCFKYISIKCFNIEFSSISYSCHLYYNIHVSVSRCVGGMYLFLIISIHPMSSKGKVNWLQLVDSN